MRCIGRLAFPIFAFMVAEGYLRTRNLGRYMLRMLVFALIAQLPYMLMTGIYGGIPVNVIFTLLFGLIALYVLENHEGPPAFLGIIVIAALAELLNFDHGAFGVLMVVLLYYTRTRPNMRSLSASILIILFSLSYMVRFGLNNYTWLIIVFYLAAVPVFNLFNKRKGMDNKFAKWFFYAFYPGHILILLISRYLF